MKKLLSVLCLIALLAAMIVPCLSVAEQSYYRWVKVNSGSTVNVRSGPGKEYEKMGALPYGTKVIVYEETNGFSLCEPVDSHHFWSNPQYIQSAFLVSYDPGTKPSPKPDPVEDEAWNNVVKAAKALKFMEEPTPAFVKTKKPGNPVHLRWFPDTNAPFSDIIYAGEEITVLAQSKTWAQVQLGSNGHVGFILFSCVDYGEE